jgi:hypothetical protein
VQNIFAASAVVRWTSKNDLEQEVANKLKSQEAAIRELVKSAQAEGFQQIPEVRVQIDVRLSDRRDGPHESLPSLEPWPFLIE